jgi:hypothetical protein
MADQTTILKNPALGQGEDYNFLRSEGLKYIEELGSSLWTDYNEHDPGITILEALCYAITELGYRTSFPMEDLLTDANGQISSSQVLFTAKNILTQAPLTVDDYRKLLIDINGVHNAWLFYDSVYTNANGVQTPAAEIPFYADCKKDILTYDQTTNPVYVSGLYKVLLDLDDDPQAGNLNDGTIEVLNPATGGYNAGTVSFSVIFPAWNDPLTDQNLLKANKDSLSALTPTVVADGTNWKLTVNFSFTVPDDVATYMTILKAEVIIDLKPSGVIVTLADMQTFFSSAFTQQVVDLYIYKIQESKRIVQTAIKTLHENRNLCEDFVNVDTIPDEEIAICCDIDVTPDTDMEEVQADVFYAIEQYLNPTVNFYLLKDMVDKGYTTDEIFEGPRLTHGFIDNGELDKSVLKQNVYASDIISIIMDIKGVLAVRNFMMTKYDENGKPVPGQTNKTWCMPITLWHKPLFSETRSKITFYKNNFPYLPSLSEVRDTLRWLHAVNAGNKLTGHADDLPVPTGKYWKLDEYTSIDYLFPQAYGIGTAGLPLNATDERLAQATQLKAYLLFYDQLLADFFSQLKNAKTLFSTAPAAQTYFVQYINSIKNTDAVYKHDGSNNSLLELVLNNQDSSVLTGNDWQNLFETNETFTDRRNRFLDHLMARFAESFNDYVLLIYSLDFETQQETKISPEDLIASKIDFLNSYSQISYQRAQAFNYFPQVPVAAPFNFAIDTTRLWDTDNVSGLEKKTARLAGISNIYRRFLYCFTMADIIITNDTPAKYRYVYTDSNNNSFTSFNTYDTSSDATTAAASILGFAKTADHYSIEANGSKQHILLKDDGSNTQAVSNDFDTEPDAVNAIGDFVTEFNKECDSEGMHLVEHILLRPRAIIPPESPPEFPQGLPPVCLDPLCDFCGEEDPFSFRISVVLPFWPVHFNNLSFRDYFENLIRDEAPAHTIVKVCWPGNDAMRNFETAYKIWLTALANYAADKTTVNELQTANDSLINILFNLHSEYPVATLHNCDESKDTNPVMLGRTILGSFNKTS